MLYNQAYAYYFEDASILYDATYRILELLKLICAPQRFDSKGVIGLAAAYITNGNDAIVDYSFIQIRCRADQSRSTDVRRSEMVGSKCIQFGNKTPATKSDYSESSSSNTTVFQDPSVILRRK